MKYGESIMTHGTLEQNRANQKRHRKKVKKELFELLGNRCANPFHINHGEFFAFPECLQVDHINGGGQKELREFRKHGNTAYDAILKKVKAGSKDYQLLCANCNWIKRFREDFAMTQNTQ
jgi:hypothetical protein